MNSYILKAFSVWLVGFTPTLGSYLSVPAGIAIGLGYFSTILWSIIGNYTPILVVHYGYERLSRIEVFKTWLKKLPLERFKHWINTYGIAFVLLITPWLGAWTVAVTMKVIGMNSKLFLVYSFFSIVIYACATAIILYTGVNLVMS